MSAPEETTTNNRWKIPLANWQMELIKRYNLQGENICGDDYSQATTRQRMLAATLGATSNARTFAGAGGNEYGLLTLIQQLEFMNHGYAVTTEQDIYYTTDLMQQFMAVQGNTEQDDPNSYKAAVALGRLYDAQANVIPATVGEKFSSWRYNNMLSSPKTWSKNVWANVVKMPMESVSKVLMVGLDKIVSLKTGDRTEGFSTASEEAKSWLEAGDAISKVITDALIFKTDTSHGRKYQDSKAPVRTWQDTNLISKYADVCGKIISTVMSAGDAGFYAKELYKQEAILKRLNTMSKTKRTDEEIHAEAIQRALAKVFQQDNAVADMLLKVRNSSAAAELLVSSLIPFIQTPTNVAMDIISYSPIGLGYSVFKEGIYNAAHDAMLKSGMIHAKDSELVDGKLTPDSFKFSQKAFVEGVARGLTGTGIAAMGMAMMSAGLLRFGRDNDKDKQRQRNVEKSLNRPYGLYIQIGDHEYEIDWAGSFGTSLAIGASVYNELQKDDHTLGDVAYTAMMSGANEFF